MGTAAVTGRDELGRIIDITVTTTADVAPPGPEVVAVAGAGGVAAFVEPTTATPEQIVDALIAAGLMAAS